MKKKYKRFTPVLVEWVDIVSDSKWSDDSEELPPMPVKTLGWVRVCHKDSLVVGHSLAADGDSDKTVIPWGCIKSVLELDLDMLMAFLKKQKMGTKVWRVFKNKIMAVLETGQ